MPNKLGERHPTENLILRAALRLFAINGYEHTTMAQIAQTAKVSISSVYHFFKNKEQLSQAVNEFLTHSTQQFIDRVARDESDPRKVFAVMIYAIVLEAVYSGRMIDSFLSAHGFETWGYWVDEYTDQFLSFMAEHPDVFPRRPLKAVAIAIAGGNTSMFRVWREGGLDDMTADLLGQLCVAHALNCACREFSQEDIKATVERYAERHVEAYWRNMKNWPEVVASGQVPDIARISGAPARSEGSQKPDDRSHPHP